MIRPLAWDAEKVFTPGKVDDVGPRGAVSQRAFTGAAEFSAGVHDRGRRRVCDAVT